MPAATVIVTTYNRLDALKCVLEGFLRQTTDDYEVIIADDGSREETGAYVREFARKGRFTLHHLWQPDEGWLKTRILNKAIAAAKGGYIIFLDGDCIPHRGFVAAHLEAAEKGRYLIGRFPWIGEDYTRRITPEFVRAGKLEGLNLPLLWDTLRGRTRMWEFSIYLPSALARWVSGFKTNMKVIGANFSVWREDLVAINGFNEAFTTWGTEDIELGYRLSNLGIQPKAVTNRAICYHYWHPRGHVRKDLMSAEISDRAQREGIVRCEKGLDAYLPCP